MPYVNKLYFSFTFLIKMGEQLNSQGRWKLGRLLDRLMDWGEWGHDWITKMTEIQDWWPSFLPFHFIPNKSLSSPGDFALCV